MSSLLIEHRSNSGSVKRWKLPAKQRSTYSYGRSKEADLVVNDPSLQGIQGYFEFRGDGEGWIYVNLRTSGDDSKKIETQITSEKEIELLGRTLVARKLENRMGRLENLFAHTFEARPGTYPYRVALRTHESRMLDISLVPDLGTPLTSWSESLEGNVTVRARTVYLTKDQFTGFQKNLPREEGSQARRVVLVTSILAVGLGALFLFSPSRDFSEAAHLEMTPHEVVTIVPAKWKKPEPTPEQKTAAAPAAAETVAASTPAPAPLARSNSLTSFSQSRISKLLGKLSIAPSKSANAVAANGVQAGTAASGTALSHLGQDLKSGQDWSKEAANGTGIQGASTVGAKGLAAGMGGIGTGKAGSGAAGLSIADEGTEVVGGLDREVIAQYVRSQLGQILYCYERALSAKPDLFGKVSVNFVIGGTGKIETRAIRENTLKNAGVENCMLERISLWKFPAPTGGTRVVVTYPFLFKSTN